MSGFYSEGVDHYVRDVLLNGQGAHRYGGLVGLTLHGRVHHG